MEARVVHTTKWRHPFGRGVLSFSKVLVCLFFLGSLIANSKAASVEISHKDSLKEEAIKQISLSRMYLESDYSLALEYARGGVRLADKHQDNLLRLQAWQNLGYVLQVNKLDSASIHAFMTCLAIAEKGPDPLRHANALDVIGSLHIVLGNYPKAIQYYKKAVALNTQHKDSLFSPSRLVVSFQNLFIAYRENRNFDTALHYALKSEEICALDSIALRMERAKNRVLLGDVYIELGNPVAAEIVLQRAIGDLEALNLVVQKNLAYFLLSVALKQQNKKVQAMDYIAKALQSASLSNDAMLQGNIHEKLSEWYAEENKLDSAYLHLKLADSIKNLLSLEEANFAITEHEMKQAFMSEAYLEKKTMRQKVLLILVISIFVVLGISWITYKLYSKTNTTLEALHEAGTKVKELLDITESKEIVLKQQSELLEKKSFQEMQAITLIDQAMDSIAAIDGEGMGKKKTKLLEVLGKAKDKNTWEEFEIQFHQLHNGFFNRLTVRYPLLSPNERKLCAFLRMNMSTKEIAGMTGQSLRAVELARIRLRKKLEITHSEQSLPQFLATI
jgi:tetratricopeptide (TPR) repeat protein